MAFLWVQQWWALPIIFEDLHMDDGQRPGGRMPPGRGGSNPRVQDRRDGETPFTLGRVATTGASHSFQFQAPSSQRHFEDGQPFHLPNQPQIPTNTLQERADGTFGMGSVASALPEYRLPMPLQGPSPSQQRFPSMSSSSTLRNQQQRTPQFAGQATSDNPGYATASPSQFAPPFAQGQHGASTSASYMQQPSHLIRSGITSPLHQATYPNPSYFPGQQPPPQQYMFYSTAPTPYGQMSPSQQTFQGLHGQQQGPMNVVGGYSAQASFSPGASAAYGYSVGGGFLRPGAMPTESRESSGSSQTPIPSAPRGPPRKPKQSGYALWVGNLPPGTSITDLKDHFSKDASADIESVFLISKSNCAFVNYRTEDACAAAMNRFHDSRFQGIRLVCRLRRNSSAPGAGVPTGPAALAPTVPRTQSATEAISQNREVSSQAEASARQSDSLSKVNDKYFIVKSLTVEDLELSARTGIWATQAHNEEALNKAYESVETVYLIFSANKSGEYFGYARMTSPINDDAASKLEWVPRTQPILDDPELPRSIPTATTEFAPKGRIIDDSARGTIFWEAEPFEDVILPEIGADDTRSEKSVEGGEESMAELGSGSQAFGKPFRIEWMSTNRLPFYRTRGLRNPWNANREVKIARDGTELETSVGRRLVQMFQRHVPNPGALPPQTGLAMPLGFSPMRPY